MRCIIKAIFNTLGLTVLMAGAHAEIDIENGYYMTLEECIAMTLRQNQTIDNSYLDRIAQKNALIKAEHAFNPQDTINPWGELDAGYETGGSLSFTWSKNPTLLGKKPNDPPIQTVLP